MNLWRSKLPPLLYRYHIELGTSIQKPMKDVEFIEEFQDKSMVTYVPGGCQFNAMRVFNVSQFIHFFL